MESLVPQRTVIARALALVLGLGGMFVPTVQAASNASNPSNGDDTMLDLPLDQLMNMVSVRRRLERVIDTPVAVSSFSEQTIADYNIRSFSDYASKTPNLAYAYGNGFTVGNPSTGITNSRTVAIRGMSGARASGFYIDDIPLPGSVDPRVLDLQNIEVLKGPQGTLFGEGSLGGNIRLITKAPNLNSGEFRYMLETGKTLNAGQINAGAEAVGNIVLVPGTAALRITAYADDYGGYLKRTYLSDISNNQSQRITVDNQGAQRNLAGSITGLLRATRDFDVSLRLMYQSKESNGFPVTWAPLPAFKPQYTMNRQANIQSGARDSWVLPSLSLTYRGAGWTLNSSTSQFSRRTRDLEDSTEGTLQITTGMPTQAAAWKSNFQSRELVHETRVSFDPIHNISGTLGIFYSKNKMDYAIPPTFAQGMTPSLLWQESERNVQQNMALFGEIYYKFLDRWTLTLGDRMFRLKQSDTHTVLVSNVNTTSSGDSASAGHSPKAALAYQLSNNAMLYGSATRGFRQGNTQLDASILGCNSSLTALGTNAESLRKIKPDAAWSYEAGGKFEFPDPGLVLTASAFHIDWENPQQQLLLTNCGLFVQGNAGEAKINGAEVELSGHLTNALRMRLGLGYQDARISKAGNTGQAVGSRVYQTPNWTASLGGVYSTRITDAVKAVIAADYSYTGNSVSSNNGPYNLVRAGYGLVNARAALNWGKSQLALNITNLTNAKPNLGDITYIGYGLFTDATRTTPIPQVATLPTRTIMLQYSEHF